MEESQDEENFDKAIIIDPNIIKKIGKENGVGKINPAIKRVSQSQSQSKIRDIMGANIAEKNNETKEREEILEQFSKEKRRFTNIKKLLEFDFFHIKGNNKPKKEKKKILTRSLDDEKREKVSINNI